MKRSITILFVLVLFSLSACGLRPAAVANPTQPVGGGAPTSDATPSLITIIDPPFPWQDLGITGSISFITYKYQMLDGLTPVPFLVHLRLSDGHVAIDWRPPAKAWLANMALSPDGDQLVLAYSPPPPDGAPIVGNTGLYTLPASCMTEGCVDVEPKPLLLPLGTDSLIDPVWSADGSSIYFAHTGSPPANQRAAFDLQRVPSTGGQPEVLIDHALWPRPSADGERLVYVAYDPPNNVNDLYQADPDGTHPEPLLPPGTFMSVDAPLFSPDGNWIYFSATGDGPLAAAGDGSQSWWERLIGVNAAEANGAPSEWWRMPADGGQPTRLTQIASPGLSGAFSPDGQWMAFVSGNGLGVYGLDSQRVTWLADEAAQGDVIWWPGE